MSQVQTKQNETSKLYAAVSVVFYRLALMLVFVLLLYTLMSMRMTLIFIWVLLLGSYSYAQMEVDLKNFMKSSFETPTSLSAKNLSQYNFVLIGGYLNEAARDHYLVYNAEVLKKLGAGGVTTLFPSSFTSVSQNRKILADKFIEIYKAGGEKPLFLIGHSKGGLETLATLLAYPQFVEQKIVSTAVIMQSPLLGNSYIDRQGLTGRIFSNALEVSPGHYSLNTNEIRKVISDPIEKLPAKTRAALSRVVKYVVASVEPQEFSRALRISSYALRIDVDYDGLVAKRDMWLPDFGTVIGNLKTDHLEHVLGKEIFLGEKYNAKKVEAFTMAVVMHAFRSRNSVHMREYRELTNKLNEYRAQNPLCDRQLMGFF